MAGWILFVVLLFVLIVVYGREKQQLSKKAGFFFEKRKKEEKSIRKDAIDRSQAVTREKITEHLIPFFPSFEYDPKDANFIGSSIDFILFDGLREGKIKNGVFIEVKTGKSADFSIRERKIKDRIQSKNVKWKILKHVNNRANHD